MVRFHAAPCQAENLMSERICLILVMVLVVLMIGLPLVASLMPEPPPLPWNAPDDGRMSL